MHSVLSHGQTLSVSITCSLLDFGLVKLEAPHIDIECDTACCHKGQRTKTRAELGTAAIRSSGSNGLSVSS